MVDPGSAQQAQVSRRRFLALLAAGATAPALAGCTSRGSAPVRPAARALPGVAPRFQGAMASNGIRKQVTTPLPHVARWARQVGLGAGNLPAGNPDHLLVLSYHNVTADGRQPGRSRPDHYTVTATDFADQMQMLSLAGFHTVRMAEVLASHAGGAPLPARSLLLTFDDGGGGQWVYADPVLAEVGYSAATFLITGHIGASPAYLTWAEAKALAKTGRWDVEAHTHDQHHFVPTGPRSRPASVLINRIWDPASGSLESSDSARSRVEADLTHSLDLLSNMGFSRPTAFAYPFSQVIEPSNDPTLPAQVAGVLHATFPLLLSNSTPGRMAQPDDLRLGLLPRLEVRSRMTALNLFDRIRTSDGVAGSEHSTGERSGG